MRYQRIKLMTAALILTAEVDHTLLAALLSTLPIRPQK